MTTEIYEECNECECEWTRCSDDEPYHLCLYCGSPLLAPIADQRGGESAK